MGTCEFRVPRARVRDEETGETTEFRSELLPRYARRTREVDEAILIYRKIKISFLRDFGNESVAVGLHAIAEVRR